MIKIIKDWFRNKPNSLNINEPDNLCVDENEFLMDTVLLAKGQQSVLDMVSTEKSSASEIIEEEEYEDEIFFPPLSAAKQASPIYGGTDLKKQSNNNLRQAISGEHNEVFKIALTLCVEKRRASIPVLQQGLDVGYEDALALLNKMTEQGLIGKARGERPRLLMNLAFETVGLWNAQGELDSEEVEGEELGGEMKRDEKYSEAVRIVIEMGRASTSVLQRRLRIGYGRAASIIDMMHREGIVGPEDGSKPRTVLVKADFLDRLDQIHDEGENW